MDIFLKVSAGILITAILCFVLSGQSKDIALLLSLFVCAISLVTALNYLKPVLEFTGTLIRIGNLSYEYLGILLKIVGIGVISQISVLVCQDAKNQSLAKVLEIVTTMVILCICVPLLEEIMTLIEAIMGEL